MKVFLYLFLTLLSFNSIAQDVSGLYSGTLVNDSTKRVQNYELALSEYRGKITGYSYTTFVVNDTLYYSIKRVKAQKTNNQLIIEDTKMLANNFPESPARGVHQINTIPINTQDSIASLNGTWKTTQTKVYYALSGAVNMKRDSDRSQSQLISHLTELNFLNPAHQDEVALVKQKNAKIKPSANNISTPTILPANQRSNNLLQTLSVNADSLILSFYDNGVIDGDSITVLFNGNAIISKQLLRATASKKTIYFNSNDSTGNLLLVAENLGSIPPNTGLLIVQDGDEKYHINFSTDMQTNAAIVFRKKKKP